MLFCISTSIAQTVVANIPLGRTPTSLAVNPVTNRVYAASKTLLSSSLQVIDGSTNTISATVPLTFQPETIAVNPTTNRIYQWTSSEVFPQSIAVNPVTSFVYVANEGFDPNHGGQSISVIDDPPPPATQLQALIQKVQQYNFAQGVANSLDSKLQNALAALESLNSGNVGTVCNKLDSFINEVEAKNGLTQAQVTDLITAANRIKRTLACDG